MPSLDLETSLQRQGYTLVAGVDEAGRGPLAGPVVAAAVILPSHLAFHQQSSLPPWLSLVDDSKKLTPTQRQRALKHIRAHAAGIGLGMATPHEIDSQGIAQATRWAMRRAVEGLPSRPTYLLIDYVKLSECGLPFQAPVRGDSLSFSIAAASIVAKVTRDRLMEEADAQYPGYDFSRHKGYPTPQHLHLLSMLGPSPIHRHSFRPVRALDSASLGGTACPQSGERESVGQGTQPPLPPSPSMGEGGRGEGLAKPTARAGLGDRGERVAKEYLKSKGYEIITTNFRCSYGEVDIVAREGDCLVFVEVRTRRSPGWYGTPEESLSKRKRERLVTTAETYIQTCPDAPEDWRIDLIAIRLDGRGALWPVEHIKNAIQLS